MFLGKAKAYAGDGNYTISQFMTDCQNQTELKFGKDFRLEGLSLTPQEHRCVSFLNAYLVTVTMIRLETWRELHLSKEKSCQMHDRNDAIVEVESECASEVRFANQVLGAAVPCFERATDFYADLRSWYETWSPDYPKENELAVVAIHKFLQSKYPCSAL